MIRVLVVDDHALVRTGLAALLEAPTTSRSSARRPTARRRSSWRAELRPDVVLMDLSMPVHGRRRGHPRAARRSPDAGRRAHLLLRPRRVSDALDAGAVGYLLKDCDPRTSLAAVRAAAARARPDRPARGASSAARRRRSASDRRLSARELQVLRLVAQGLANKQIGRALGISERTVKVHLGNVFRRIGVADRISAALWARDNLPAAPG